MTPTTLLHPYIFRMNQLTVNSPSRSDIPINLEMATGEHWIVYGNNASGKTTLLKAIMSSYRITGGSIVYDFYPATSTRTSDNIVYLSFHDQYSCLAGNLYQLRWNQGLMSQMEAEGHHLPTVGQILSPTSFGDNVGQQLYEALGIASLSDKLILSLSSGEFRLFQIAKILIKHPRLLILENPFAGLDTSNRQIVAHMLRTLMQASAIQLIVATCRMPHEMDGFTHVVTVDHGTITKCPVKEFHLTPTPTPEGQLPSHVRTSGEKVPDIILKMNHVDISYNGHALLRNVCWEVKKGEKWALVGSNGSGKSTLLSIICADNPQGYACDITLFGRRRGTGESIWDIKKGIGYVCPEMFRSYHRPFNVEAIVASGLYDTAGMYKKISAQDMKLITPWMEAFHIESLRHKLFTEISDGEKRMVLLTRAFVKNPLLLILDEPFHGLDANNRNLARSIIEDFCRQPGKTLIMVSHYDDDFPSCIQHRKILHKPIHP